MALATRGLAILLAALCLFAGRSAWAATYSADVIDGSYRDCRIIWSGDRITVSFTVDFKDASGNMAGRTFLSGDSHLFIRFGGEADVAGGCYRVDQWH